MMSLVRAKLAKLCTARFARRCERPAGGLQPVIVLWYNETKRGDIMKKFVLYTSILIVLLCIISAAILILCNSSFLDELPQRLAPYHNNGKITVKVDGEQINLEGIEINQGLFYMSTQNEKVATIKSNEFKFKEGSYGENMFRFIIPIKEFGNVTVEFGHFNTNWWHQVHYDIELNLITNADGTLTADISQKVSYGGKERFSHCETDMLDQTNRLTSIYVGS